jgi:L-amino acid N-acyltransferase YncA
MLPGIEPAGEDDGKAIIDIFNHYIENSFAAYPAEPVPYQFFEHFRRMSEGYPFLLARYDGKVLGFAMLRPYSPIPAFSMTAEISCFVAPGHTGKGIGSALQEALLDEARNMGIRSVLAGISSLNRPSLEFHRRRGFVQCGRFVKIGRKWEEDFDVVWMQKMIRDNDS